MPRAWQEPVSSPRCTEARPHRNHPHGCRSTDQQLLFKTRADRYAELEAHLLEHHPWKNPEVSAVPIVAGSDAYLRWVERTTEPESGN
ncbi:divalent cation tolerance protein CutA [Streptomyces sp. NPDC003442]